jgi:23S rRNA pseudouridine2605 synthase
VRYGPFELPRRLARGKSEELKAEQVEKLLSVVPAKGKQRKGPAEEARPPVDGEAPTSPKRGRRRGPRKPREAGEGGNRAAPQQSAPSPQGGEGDAPARKRAPRRRRRPSAKPAAGGGEA